MKKMFLCLLLAAAALLPLYSAPRQPKKLPPPSAPRAAWYSKKVSPQLVDADGKRVNAASALNGKMVAFYFSASWCPPCRSFTPQLVDFHKRVGRKNNFEIVLVSSDRNARAMQSYMKKYKMPWLAMPFKSPAATALQRELKVSGIPTLVVFDHTGKIVSRNGRADVLKHKGKAIDIWKKASAPAPKRPAAKGKTARKKGKK